MGTGDRVCGWCSSVPAVIELPFLLGMRGDMDNKYILGDNTHAKKKEVEEWDQEWQGMLFSTRNQEHCLWDDIIVHTWIKWHTDIWGKSFPSKHAFS